jgi:hypothetical protein
MRDELHRRYPGLTVLDFYPDIAKESSLGTRLHLVLSPFVELSQDKTIEPICNTRFWPIATKNAPTSGNFDPRDKQYSGLTARRRALLRTAATTVFVLV